MDDRADINYHPAHRRMALGAIRGNITQHMRAKHTAQFTFPISSCKVCVRLDHAYMYFNFKQHENA